MVEVLIFHHLERDFLTRVPVYIFTETKSGSLELLVKSQLHCSALVVSFKVLWENNDCLMQLPVIRRRLKQTKNVP